MHIIFVFILVNILSLAYCTAAEEGANEPALRVTVPHGAVAPMFAVNEQSLAYAEPLELAVYIHSRQSGEIIRKISFLPEGYKVKDQPEAHVLGVTSDRLWMKVFLYQEANKHPGMAMLSGSRKGVQVIVEFDLSQENPEPVVKLELPGLASIADLLAGDRLIYVYDATIHSISLLNGDEQKYTMQNYERRLPQVFGRSVVCVGIEAVYVLKDEVLHRMPFLKSPLSIVADSIGSVALSGERLAVMGEGELMVVTLDGEVVWRSGKVFYQQQTKYPLAANATSVLVYEYGRLYCFNILSGELLWYHVIPDMKKNRIRGISMSQTYAVIFGEKCIDICDVRTGNWMAHYQHHVEFKRDSYHIDDTLCRLLITNSVLFAAYETAILMYRMPVFDETAAIFEQDNLADVSDIKEFMADKRNESAHILQIRDRKRLCALLRPYLSSSEPADSKYGFANVFRIIDDKKLSRQELNVLYAGDREQTFKWFDEHLNSVDKNERDRAVYLLKMAPEEIILAYDEQRPVTGTALDQQDSIEEIIEKIKTQPRLLNVGIFEE